MPEYSSLGFVYLSQLESVLEKMKNNANVQGIQDPEISFECLIGTFFPRVLDNIHDEMNRQYTLGYIQGQGGQKNDE